MDLFPGFSVEEDYFCDEGIAEYLDYENASRDEACDEEVSDER